MKKLLFLFIIAIFITSFSYAHEVNISEFNTPVKTKKEIDEYLSKRLNLTQEQKEIISAQRHKNMKLIKEIVNDMEDIHIKIRNVYLTGIPKWQADLRTAKLKTDLVALKQKADKLKEQRRKNFESILSEEQKIEFEKIRAEFAQKQNLEHHRNNINSSKIH